MTETRQATVTRLLERLRTGDQSVVDQLFPLVYDELRRLARRQRASWHGEPTLNTTALVHEAYIKLAENPGAEWEGRSHFLGVAAKAMRHILIDHAKRRRAKKRGGDMKPIALDDVILVSEDRVEELLALDQALDRLAEMDERQSRIVECRFFGGMTLEETATVLDVSVPTVSRAWRTAQAWLYNELEGEVGLSG